MIFLKKIQQIFKWVEINLFFLFMSNKIDHISYCLSNSIKKKLQKQIWGGDRFFLQIHKFWYVYEVPHKSTHPSI